MKPTISIFLTLFLILQLFSSLNGLKFLLSNPKVGRSHVMHIGKLADILVKGGHEVINYQVAHSKVYSDTGTKLARTIVWEPKIENQFNFSVFEDIAWKGRSYWALSRAFTLAEKIQNSCEDQLQDEDLFLKLKAEKIDFAFTEFTDLCSFLMFEKLGIKRYAILSVPSLPLWMTSFFGVPSAGSSVPDFMDVDGISQFTFFQRFKKFVSSTFTDFYFKYSFMKGYSVLGKKYLRQDFDVVEKLQESQMVFVNVDEHLDFPRSVTHKIHYIGGVGMKAPEPLSKKYAKIMEQGDKFIYMSFGTVAQSVITMPNETKTAFLEAFSRFPHIKFLWKYERPSDQINANHPNVILEDWWPQHSLLPHNKILGFITHGGMNSVSEASQAGVPLISIPLMGDQHRNAKMAEFRGFGIVLDVLSLSANSIEKAIKEITENEG